MMKMDRRHFLQGLSAATGALFLPVQGARAQAARGFRVGDRYLYRRLDPYSGVEQGRYATEVIQVTDSEVVFSDGRVLDMHGYPRRLPDGRRITMLQAPPADVAPGGRWRAEYLVTLANGTEIRGEMDGSVAGRETITVPAGTFDALRIEGRGIAQAPMGVVRTELRLYRAPGQVRMPLVREEIRRGSRGHVFFAERHELVEFRQS
jgi:hypothetical protein